MVFPGQQQVKKSSTTIYYLEMLNPEALCPKQAPDGFEISMIDPPSPQINRRFYEDVGGPWDWNERLVWSDDQWSAYANRPDVETWVSSLDGQEVGYFELESQAEGSVEIRYFGLLSEYIGRGLGGALLTVAVRRAWAMDNTRRVWVHTCTKDHPLALDNYRRRGFIVYKTRISHG